MSGGFDFESDFVASLRCIPMAMRYRLDLAGVKMKLNEWSKLPLAERQALLDMPCGTPAEIDACRAAQSAAVAKACGTAPSLLPGPVEELWESPSPPAQVREKAASEGVRLADADWAALPALQRFALVKLSRPGHENRNFVPAALEFGLLKSA